MPEGVSHRAVVVTAALGTMLLPLNSTMIAVALPDIAGDLAVPVHATAWLVTGYLIAQAALQPLAGKLGDRFGRRPLMLAGLGAFGVVSLAAALAPGLGMLIAFRVLQAIAGALVFPNALALIRELLPLRRRGTAFGMLGSAIGLAAAAGPPLGGVLVGVGGWRLIFLVNVPWIAAAAVMALRTVPRRAPGAPHARFDVAGAVGLSALLAAAAWLLNPSGLGAGVVAVATAALAVLAVVFVRYELAHADPVLQPRFLRVRAFAAATGSVGLSNLALYGTLLAVPVLLAGRPGWSSAEVGLTLAALSVPLFALSAVGGLLSDRLGRRSAALTGLSLLTVALVPLGVAGEDVGVRLLVACLALAGAGLGLSNAAVQTAGIEALAERDAGVASGLFSTGRYAGGIAAASLVSALVNGGAPRFGLLFALEAGAAGLSTMLAFALPGRPAPVGARPEGAAAAP